jgi:hypothetical protein
VRPPRPQHFQVLMGSLLTGLALWGGVAPPDPRAEGEVVFRAMLPSGQPAARAAVVLRPSFVAAPTGADGATRLTVPPGTYTARASVTQDGVLHVGSVEAIRVTDGRSESVLLRLKRAPRKPAGRGEVRVRGRVLFVRGRPFQLRGVGYEPPQIGIGPGWRPAEDVVYRRDFPLLAQMSCNVIRTWGPVDESLVRIAEEHRIRVIAGFWVPYELRDLGDPVTRARLIGEFRAYVARFHAAPAVLMFAIGNEQNYQNGNTPAWYSLLNEMAWAAYDEEGRQYHPVTAAEGEIANIGTREKLADDASLPYLDCWGANIYRGATFGTLFRDYARRSRRPFWVSEYGCDAYDHRQDAENEATQARYATSLWKEIDAAKKVCIGGTLMAYCDQWWKGGDPHAQKPGGPAMGAAMDGIADEAYWGIMKIARDPAGGLDRVTPRQIYFALQALWKSP